MSGEGPGRAVRTRSSAVRRHRSFSTTEVPYGSEVHKPMEVLVTVSYAGSCRRLRRSRDIDRIAWDSPEYRTQLRCVKVRALNVDVWPTSGQVAA